MRVVLNELTGTYDVRELPAPVLVELREALLKQVPGYEDSIELHNDCALGEVTGCKRFNNQARCSEDLTFLHGQLALLHETIFEIDQQVP